MSTTSLEIWGTASVAQLCPHKMTWPSIHRFLLVLTRRLSKPENDGLDSIVYMEAVFLFISDEHCFPLEQAACQGLSKPLANGTNARTAQKSRTSFVHLNLVYVN